ncbi:hypothetical protein EV175_005213 [Coemansia sp. RSA 1933]|nr:hypothetical protein EV175_005213 [Coemansia sp. RSA 1933]
MTEQVANAYIAGYPPTNQILDILFALERSRTNIISVNSSTSIDDNPKVVSKAQLKSDGYGSKAKYVGSIPLVAPLEPETLVYLLSRSGVTSTRQSVDANVLARLLSQVKRSVEMPLTIDMGISAHRLFAKAEPVRKHKRISAEKASAKSKKTVAKADMLPRVQELDTMKKETILPDKFGQFGGLYVAEALYECVLALEKTYVECKNDPAFWEEFRSLYPYMGRPSPLHFAERLTERCSGAKIYLKREDLCHTGSHKINNVVGQLLIAKRLGKSRIIAETGAGQHGVATAAMCAKLGLECVIYMGSEDMRRQSLNVFRIRALGGKVVPVTKGSCTLKDAINEAMRDLVSNLDDTYHLVSSAIGCHPFPTMVRDFQCVIGNETKEQVKALTGRRPNALVACVGGGSNSIGMFYPFIEHKNVRLVGVEAAGEGIDTTKHSATLSAGSPGVFHGAKTYLLQDKKGQVMETHSIAPGLNYPGVSPEHAWLRWSGRAEYHAVTNAQAIEGFRSLAELEGIIPSLEASHAIYKAMQVASSMNSSESLVVCVNGNGDKDLETLSDIIPSIGS